MTIQTGIAVKHSLLKRSLILLAFTVAWIVPPSFVDADTFKIETILRGVSHPWSLNFAPDGRLYFTERPGRLSVFDPASGKVTAITGVPKPRVEGEAGLLGLALDPGFADNGLIYLCYSTRNQGYAANRLSRFHLAGNALAEEKILLDHMPGASYHDGCRVIVSPDGKYLFFSMGEAGRAQRAQALDYPGGKIFRIALDGSIPADNPFLNSPVWTFGNRNPQGLRFRPGSDEFWATEHGADTQDELNLIEKGGNYGWPICRGTDPCPGIANYHPAIAEFDHADTIAISDLIFYDGKKLPEWKGNILFVSLKTGRLYRLVLDGDRVAKTEILIDGQYGRLRDIAEGPDGALYISTDNDDDVIMRVAPQ
jgi:glucose/arabinose dehydrogenase